MHSGVDWKAALKNAIWWAVDEDGTAHWFKSPNVVPFTAFWFVESVTTVLYPCRPDPRTTKLYNRLRDLARLSEIERRIAFELARRPQAPGPAQKAARRQDNNPCEATSELHASKTV
jgi:hypothetical protein